MTDTDNSFTIAYHGLAGDVNVTLHFFSPPQNGESPEFRVTDRFGNGKRNYPHDPHEVRIRDMRGHEHDFSLEHHGFAVIHQFPISKINFDEDKEVKRAFYPVVKIILNEATKDSKIIIFDHTVRSAALTLPCRPVRKVHIDQTPEAVKLRLSRHLGTEETEEILRLRSRVQLINVWMPLNGPVLDHPIALAESKTVEDQDLVTVRHAYPDREGETYAVRYNERQRWWYWSQISNEELLLFKCFDSGEDGPLGWQTRGNVRVAHASFAHPGTPDGVNMRSSIEIRCLIIV